MFTQFFEKFYLAISQNIYDDNLTSVSELVKSNLDVLVKNACEYSPYKKVEQGKDKCSRYAYEILIQFVTDDRIMQYVCSKDFDFLDKIIQLEKKYYIGNNLGIQCIFDEDLYTNIMYYMLMNKNSYLYQQIEFNKGFSKNKNIYMLITDETIISRTRIMPFITISDLLQKVSAEKYMTVLCELFMILLDNYKNDPTKAGLYDGRQLRNMDDVLDMIIGTGHYDGLIRNLVASERQRRDFFEDQAIR